jgi:prevent-host-death family protein
VVAVRWQVQELKQRTSEVLRAVESEGDQIITRHGREIAVLVDMEEYRRLKGESGGFKELLSSAPPLDVLDEVRAPDLGREIDWGER